MQRWILLVGLTVGLVGPGCGSTGEALRPKTKNSRRGSCRDYKPVCIVGVRRCHVDERGCDLCSCVQETAPDLGPGQPGPR